MPSEREADQNPVAVSHLRLALLILEGYFYLLLIIGVFVGAIVLLARGVLARRPFVGLVALFIGVPLVVTTASAIRALFFRLPAPQGIPVTAHQAPRLFEMVEGLRQQVQAPKVHRILVGAPFNASASQLPRAVLFWPRNTLLIGYPLLATLPPDHVRAVVAHELAHLSHAHGRFSAWVCRTRLSWHRLMGALTASGGPPIHARLLFRWYAPRLYAQSAAIARQQELLADRLAAAAVGSAYSAETLVAIEAAASDAEQAFWDRVFERVEAEPEPPQPFAAMGPDLWSSLPEDSSTLTTQLLRSETEPGDTHPSLRDRLEAIGEPARLPAREDQTAGDVFLGPHMPVLAKALDEKWESLHGANWRRHHETLKTQRERLRVLTALTDPTPDEIFERGQLVEGLDGIDSALPHYREALDRSHAGAMLAVGRILLERNDDSGVALIERAMAADARLVSEGCDLVIPYLDRQNRRIEGHRFTVMATRHATRTTMADQERQQVSAFDRFAPHSLTASDIASLAAWLARQPEITHAFLVTRDLRYSAGTELVCALVANGASVSAIADDLRREALLPANTHIVVLGRQDQPLRAALEAVPASLITDH